VNKSRLFTKYLLFAISALFAAELLLRSFGLFLTLPSDTKNRILSGDSSRLRILAIGESTSADFYSKDVPNGAWPRQLEIKLKESGINARVYNEGVTGTETPYVASRLQMLLETYNPQIVISMLGVNDRPNGLRYDGSPSSKFTLFLNHLRLFRVLTWIKGSFIPSCEFDEKLMTLSDEKIADEAAKYAATKPLSEVESFLRETIQDDHRIALILLTVGRRLSGKKVSWTNTDAHRPFLDRAFDLYPHNSNIAIYTLEMKKDLDPSSRSISPERFSKVSKILLECADSLPSYHLAVIADHSLNNKIDIQGEYQNFVFAKTGESDLAYHYRMINRILQENHVQHLAMQYPTLAVDPLRHLFSDESGNIMSEFKDIKYISNENNFKNALQKASYESFFTDKFGGTWGHATKAGNSLIAEAAKAEVIKLIESDFPDFKTSAK
jgi:hypothetical protein